MLVSTCVIAAATAGWCGGDLRVHLVRDRAVARVALAPGAQLDQVHRLARVEVEHVADAEAEAERVGRGVAQAGRGEALVLLRERSSARA